MKTEFIVMTASEKMPNSCWGKYGKVAVCEVEEGVTPKMISERAIGMVRIVHFWRRLNWAGPRSAFAVAECEARTLAAKLNKETSP